VQSNICFNQSINQSIKILKVTQAKYYKDHCNTMNKTVKHKSLCLPEYDSVNK